MGKSRIPAKNRLYNLGLSLKDNTSWHPEVSSSSTKAPTVKPAHCADSVTENEVIFEL